VQAEIGQNRLIFPMRSNQPRIIVTNGLTEPTRLVRTMRANFRARTCRKTLAATARPLSGLAGRKV
jgi:hypothetical protein